MFHLIFDTCIWLDLLKNPFDKIPEKILYLIENEKAKIIISPIIIEEWQKNKQKIEEESKKSVAGKEKNAKELADYLPPDLKDEFLNFLRYLPDGWRENRISTQLQTIEQIIYHPLSLVAEITHAAKMQAVDFALAKKAPFHKKNSMADALILFSVVEYVNNENLTNSIFISANKEDFSSNTSNTSAEIHEDLKDLLNKVGIKYYINIGQAINEIEKHLVNEEKIRQIDEFYRQKYMAFSLVFETMKYIQQNNLTNGGVSFKINEEFIEQFRISKMSQNQELENIKNAISSLQNSPEKETALKRLNVLQESIQANLNSPISLEVKEAIERFSKIEGLERLANNLGIDKET